MSSTTRPLVLLVATMSACMGAFQACSSDSGSGGTDAGTGKDSTSSFEAGADTSSPGVDSSKPDTGGVADTGGGGADTGGGGQDAGHDAEDAADAPDAPKDAQPDVPADSPPDAPPDVMEAQPPGDAPPDSPLDAGPCTYTLSGATSASGNCNESFVLSSQGLSFVLAAPVGSHPLMSFTTYPGGSTPQTGTYTTANVTCSSSDVTINPPVASPQYLEISGVAPCGGGGALSQGTFTLTITDVGTMATIDGGSAWYGVHGSLTASLPGVPGDVNSPGTVTVTATF